MRAPTIRVHDLVVDNFAGGGGASLGIEWAIGRSPDIAVNHDPEAIAMHAENHPSTRHLCGDVWDVNPRDVCGGRPVALAWFSPDCKHFSKAKGGKPVEKKIRGLAWVVVRWARAVRPRVIILENVEEFETWGPLLRDGRPDPLRRGLTFRRWVGQLQAAGYAVEMRQLRACDYGAPTSRKRLFVIARCDGLPIVWPDRTHGPDREASHRVAAECIEWSLPCPSIFGREKPLADKTLARIGRGVWKYVIDAQRPFIVPVSHGGDLRTHSVDEPFRTVTGAHRGELAFVSPSLICKSWGERVGQEPRIFDIQKPLTTVVGGGIKHALVTIFLAKHFGGHETPGSPADAPFGTVTARDHHALVAAHLRRDFGQSTGSPSGEPAPTVTAGGGGHLGLVASHMVKLFGTCPDGQRIDAPSPTVRAGGTHLGEVRSFLLKYNRTGGARSLDLPFDAVTTRDRFGIVRVDGDDYEIADIGMRMLAPRELYRAQGFPDSYRIDFSIGARPLTKTAQVRMCGNSVSPPVAAALVVANVAVERSEVA